MSELTQFDSAFIEETELLENIDRKLQLVSSSSESTSPSNRFQRKGTNSTADMVPGKNFLLTSNFRQSSDSLNSPVVEKSRSPTTYKKLHSSCNDLCRPTTPNRVTANTTSKQSLFQRSASCDNLKRNKPNGTRVGRYDHVQSKVKQYFKDTRVISPLQSTKVLQQIEKEETEPARDEYLQEINKRLTKELEEKNIMLMKLQENYEQLLLKYAEAQNRIDQLRFKSISGSPECSSRTGTKIKSARTSFRVPLASFYGHQGSKEENQDGKCQKAIVAPFKKEAEQIKIDDRIVAMRPQTLPIDCSLKILERDVLKAATPTDSEGVSSVITSMSGHSKILNTLDEDDSKPKEQLHYDNPDFILKGNAAVSDPYDKVKNWQKSLPPLEFIETPETNLYDDPVATEHLDPEASPSTNYNEMSETLPNITDMDQLPCTWASEFPTRPDLPKNRTVSQAVMKKYLRTLSLPSSLSRRNLMSLIYKRKNHHTIDLSMVKEDERQPTAPAAAFADDSAVEEVSKVQDVPPACIIRRQRKKSPFMRSASLPVYDYDSPKSVSGRNGVFIPPLDLDNLTISDDITSPEFPYNLSKSIANTSPSFITSRGDSAHGSFQTLQSMNSCKATISEFSDSPFPRTPRLAFHKSTSITPERSKEMTFPALYEEYPVVSKCTAAGCRDKAESCSMCNVCGETINDLRQAGPPEPPVRRTKHPFNRSVSFNSDISPSYFEGDVSSFQRRSHDVGLDHFDVYANNLKARSQVIMKALTAHVNNA